MTAFSVSSRPMQFLLIASLALNLLLVAAIGAYSLRQNTQTAGERWAAKMERLADAMPAADGGMLRGALAAHMPTLEAARAELRTSREAIAGALRTDPFDRAALERAMADFGIKRVGLQRAYQAMIADGAAGMSADGRAKMADWSSRRR